MEERRRHVRLAWGFPVILSKDGIERSLAGTTVNVSQSGALIRIHDWPSFQVDEQVVFACFLPPYFTGQDQPIKLQGEVIIRRVEPTHSGIAVEFVESFRRLKRMD